MRFRFTALWLVLWICSGLYLQAASAKIIKVLPHYLDEEGRLSLSPSLYERDAYQAMLRKNPDLCAALRFDINWKAKHSSGEPLLLRLELRSSGQNSAQPIVLEQPVRPSRFFSTWSSLRLKGDSYKTFGQLIAWRATLWRDNQMVAEQKSYLW